MNAYYTKCGREFTKSVKADTTGYVLTEQPEQETALGQIVDSECAACPFVVDVKEGFPEQKDKRFECRAGSLPPNHKNEWQGSLEDKCTIRVLSLDHELCEAIIAYCGDQPDLYANYNGQDHSDCRKSVSVGCSYNKKGVAAKRAFIEKFFPQVNASSDPTDDPSDTEAEVSSYNPQCPFLKVISEKSIQCGGFDCKILGNVDFSDAHKCSDWANGKCFDRFLDCEHYRKYYSDPQIIKPEDKRCIRCCNNSWYMGLPDGYDGQKYCFCQRKQTPMLHDNHCEWFDRYPEWPLEPTEENGSH